MSSSVSSPFSSVASTTAHAAKTVQAAPSSAESPKALHKVFTAFADALPSTLMNAWVLPWSRARVQVPLTQLAQFTPDAVAEVPVDGESAIEPLLTLAVRVGE